MYLRSLVVALHMILTVGAVAADEGHGKRVALIIGNGFYRGLPAPIASVGDAHAVGRTFEKLAFTKVTILTDLTRDAFEHAIRDFKSDAADADWAVVYYAGGGLRVENKNYLIPVDARPAVDLDIASVAVPVDSIVWALSDARALRLIILDTARGASVVSKLVRASSTRLMSEGLAPLPRNDDLVLYSRQTGPAPTDDTDRSPLSKALADNLPKPGIGIADMLHRVQAEVIESSRRTQDAPVIGPFPISDIFLSDVNHGASTPGVPHKGNGGSEKPAGTGPSSTGRPSDCFVFSGEKAC